MNWIKGLTALVVFARFSPGVEGKAQFLPFLSSKDYYEARVGCSLELSFYVPVDPYSSEFDDPNFFFYLSRDLNYQKGYPFFMHYQQIPGSSHRQSRAYWTTFQPGSTLKNNQLDETFHRYTPEFLEEEEAKFHEIKVTDNSDQSFASLGWKPMTEPENRFDVTMQALSTDQRNNNWAYMFVRLVRVTIKTVKPEDAGVWYLRGAFNQYQGKATAFSVYLKQGTTFCPDVRKRLFGPAQDLIFREDNNQELSYRRKIRNTANAKHSNAVALVGPFNSLAGTDDRFLVESLNLRFAVLGKTSLSGTQGKRQCNLYQEFTTTKATADMCNFETSNSLLKSELPRQAQAFSCVSGNNQDFNDDPGVKVDDTRNTWCKEGIELRVYDPPVTKDGKTYMTIDQTAYYPHYFHNTIDPFATVYPAISWPKTPLTLRPGQYLGIVKKLLSINQGSATSGALSVSTPQGEVIDSEYLYSGPVKSSGFCRNKDAFAYADTPERCKGEWIEELGAEGGDQKLKFFSVPDELILSGKMYSKTVLRDKINATYFREVDNTLQNSRSVQLQLPFAKGQSHEVQELPTNEFTVGGKPLKTGFAFNAKTVFYDTYYPPTIVERRVVAVYVDKAKSNFINILIYSLSGLLACCCLCCILYSRQAKRLKERRMFMASMLGTSFNISSETGEPLPPNWYEEKTPEGNIYYYNPTTQESMWDIPTFG